MKTEEDFRNSIGQADEEFARRIRQTLMELNAEEKKPVKKQSAELHLATIPAEYVPTGDTFTLRMQNPDNAARVYDQYTYTMK